MYLVLALPRSRTAWLSSFLTYGDWTCGHEEACNMRDIADVKALLSRPLYGTAETAVASNWRLIRDLCPTAKIVTVRRPVHEVVESVMALPIAFDRSALTQVIQAADRKLDQIEARLPVMSVSYANLAKESVCKAIFEHCLPYAHDRVRWKTMNKINVQINVPSLMGKIAGASADLESLIMSAKIRTIANMNAKRASAWQH